MLHGFVYAKHLRIRFGIHQAGESVTCVAADAPALVRILLIQHHAHGNVKRAQSLRGEVVSKLLDARFMAHRRPWILLRCPRFGWILSTAAMHLIELFGLRVVRLELAVGDGPCRRSSTVVV